MAKRSSVEDALARLHALREQKDSPELAAELSAALAGKINLLIARAANIVARHSLAQYTEDLSKAFDRLMSAGPGSDKGCMGKTAIVKALYEVGAATESIFLAGAHHVQMEAAFGGPVDAAAELRGLCGLGLVRMAYRDVTTELVDLLMDREPQVRIMAARALAYSGRDEGIHLLRMKLLAGDREVDVTAECLTALLKLCPDRCIAFAARFLDADDPALVQAAALALGETRRPAAVEELRQRCQRQVSPEERRPLLLGIACARLPEAIDYLLSLVREASPATAADSTESLRIFRHDSQLRGRIEEAIAARKDEKLRQRLLNLLDQK